ncbi:MAG TPA: sugar ABC transporter permease [Candidatus Eisenbergiella intestinipullorum]|nr:sugar ABC transporter permease [Candidatus Eisenbergiella intestinipullorum]
MSSAVRKKSKKNQKPLSERFAPVFFLAPAIVMLIAISIIPIGYSFYLSFQSYNLAMPPSTRHFVGLDNYIAMLTNDNFIDSIQWTLIFALVVVVIETVLGLLIASMLNSELANHFAAPFKTLLIIPMMVAAVVSATVWKLMFYPVYGVVNNTFALLGLPQVNWLGETFYAKIAIIIVEIWMATPFCVLVFQAALKTVSSEMIEAARVDGASGTRIFFSITLPTIRNFVALVVSIRISDALRAFDAVMQLTNGAPGASTETIGTTIYKTAFRYNNVGEGSAGAFIFFVVVSIVAVVTMMLMRKRND